MKESKMSSHLTGGRLNVSLIQETMRKELLNLLQLCEGPKVTIWDEWLVGPVDLVAQYSLLKEHEVVDMFPLRPGSLPTISVKHIVFIARPKLALMDLIADYIQSLRSTNPFDSDAESVAAPVSAKKKIIKPVKKQCKKAVAAASASRRQRQLFGSDSESDGELLPSTSQLKRKRAYTFPDSEDEDSTNKPVRAAALKSYLYRRSGTGYTQQWDPTRRGDYYVELRVSNCRELEGLTEDLYKHSIISLKAAVKENSPLWRATSQLVVAAKEDFKGIQPILYSRKNAKNF